MHSRIEGQVIEYQKFILGITICIIEREHLRCTEGLCMGLNTKMQINVRTHTSYFYESGGVYRRRVEPVITGFNNAYTMF